MLSEYTISGLIFLSLVLPVGIFLPLSNSCTLQCFRNSLLRGNDIKIGSNAYSIVHNRAVILRGMPERSANAKRSTGRDELPSCRMKQAKDPLGKDAGGETGATGGLTAPLGCPVPNVVFPYCYCLLLLRAKTPDPGRWLTRPRAC